MTTSDQFTLQIVSFDVPHPPTYGGVIDVYERIKALTDAGVEVLLHCFTKDRFPAPHLAEICKEVHYYKRKPVALSILPNMPYITASRRSRKLLKRLKSNPAPILFEGLHCCYYLGHEALSSHIKWVRMHNVEHEYYQQLAEREPDFGKRAYLRWEGKRLRQYEEVLKHAQKIWAISPSDEISLTSRHENVFYLPAFSSYDKVESLAGKGEYALYHGKLSVPENHEAAMFLLQKVWVDLDIPLVIAGSSPQPDLLRAISDHPNVRLVHAPEAEEMEALQRNAHLHVLPGFQKSGIKLKLLHALFKGRFVITTPEMVTGTDLEQVVMVAADARTFRGIVARLMLSEFSEMEISAREAMLGTTFNKSVLTNKLIASLNPT